MKDYTVPLTLISILADAEFHSGEQLGEFRDEPRRNQQTHSNVTRLGN